MSTAADLERLTDAAALLEEPTERKRMLVVVNPYATTMSDRIKSLVVAALASRFEVTAIDTQRQGHGVELAREAAGEGYDVIVAFGGDGTVNEVVNGLAGSDTPVSCLPGGATNVFCRLLGIPAEIVDATEHLLRLADHWEPRRVDLGRVNGRLFTFATGLGLDAAVVREVDQRPARKRTLGEWYFLWSAIRTFAAEYLVRPPRVAAEVDGRRLEGINLILQNGDPFTFFDERPIRVAEDVSLASGDLAGVMLHRATVLDVPTVLLRVFSRRLRTAGHRHITAFSHLRTLRAVSPDGRPVPLQVDGDWIGDVTEAEFAAVPRAVRVVA